MSLTVKVNDASADRLNLIAPPFWSVNKTKDDGDPRVVHFTLTAPSASAVREADFIVTLDAGQRRPHAELYLRAAVSE